MEEWGCGWSGRHAAGGKTGKKKHNKTRLSYLSVAEAVYDSHQKSLGKRKKIKIISRHPQRSCPAAVSGCIVAFRCKWSHLVWYFKSAAKKNIYAVRTIRNLSGHEDALSLTTPKAVIRPIRLVQLERLYSYSSGPWQLHWHLVYSIISTWKELKSIS